MKREIGIILILLFTIGFVFAFSGSGSGSSEDPYQITTCTQLQEMDNNLTADYKLMQDIDCSSIENFESIGDWWSSQVFTGNLNGNSKTISNLTINSSSRYIGIFSDLRGDVNHLVLLNPTITSTSDGTAALAGRTDGAYIYDVNVLNATINGGYYVGALVGYNYNYSTITNCHSSGTITGTGIYAGGITGSNHVSTITNCDSNATVNGTEEVGGITGYNWGGTVIYSNFSGQVNSTIINAGGISGGTSGGTISQCYSTGDINGVSRVGGIAGRLVGTITNSYFTGTVSGTSEVGGLTSAFRSDSTITNSYSNGLVTFTSSGGGLIGSCDGGCGSITNSYWDTQTSGQETSAAGTAKTTSQLSQQSTYSSWDFSAIWTISEGSTYAYFDWQTENIPTVSETTYYSTGTFTSKTISLGSAKDFNLLNFSITEPSGTNVQFQLRSATSEVGLDSATWYGPTSTSDYYTTTGTTINSVHDGNSWVQWKGYLSGNGSATPTITDVNILTTNHIDSNAIFVGGSGTSRTWSTYSISQTLNSGSISWFYCTSWPCSSWTSLESTSGSLSGTSAYIYFRGLMSASSTNNSPSITQITINYE